jgi:divalent metal cation (Fe/Co/Zn/Cd) transporter
VGSAAVDLHVRVSPERTVQEANAIADEVRRRLLILDGVIDVTVHVEAQRRPEPYAPDLFATIKLTAEEFGLVVHEVWAHRVGSDLFSEMHIGVDPQLTLGEAHALVDRLEQEVLKRLPELKGVHTHIELATTRVGQGEPASQELESQVRRVVEAAVVDFPPLSNPHNIQVRRDPAAGSRLFISLECSVPAELPVTEAHHLASRLEQELARRLGMDHEVSVHLEPPEEGQGTSD